MTKPIIVVKVPCKLLCVIQVKEFLIKCLTSWPYLISEFLVAYITIVASDWPRTFFTPKVFLFSITLTCPIIPALTLIRLLLSSDICFWLGFWFLAKVDSRRPVDENRLLHLQPWANYVRL